MFFSFRFMAGVGLYKTFHALYILNTKSTEARPGAEVLESLDLFLVAFVFLILAFSFTALFNPQSKIFSEIYLPWLKIDDFFKLKHVIWNTMLLTMINVCGTHIFKDSGRMEWQILTVPIAVLLLSAIAKLLKG